MASSGAENTLFHSKEGALWAYINFVGGAFHLDPFLHFCVRAHMAAITVSSCYTYLRFCTFRLDSSAETTGRAFKEARFGWDSSAETTGRAFKEARFGWTPVLKRLVGHLKKHVSAGTPVLKRLVGHLKKHISAGLQC